MPRTEGLVRATDKAQFVAKCLFGPNSVAAHRLQNLQSHSIVDFTSLKEVGLIQSIVYGNGTQSPVVSKGPYFT